MKVFIDILNLWITVLNVYADIVNDDDDDD